MDVFLLWKTYLFFNRSQMVPFPEPGPPITKMMIGFVVDVGAIINDVIIMPVKIRKNVEGNFSMI